MNFHYKNNQFKILQLTDVHFTDDCADDKKTTLLMDRLIQMEKPDLIVLTGDFLTGEENVRYAATGLKPLTDSGIPWCFVFGNHDTEYGEKYAALTNELFTLPGCVQFKTASDIDGMSNYTLKLYDNNEKLSWVFFMMDSNAYNANPRVGGYDFIHFSQINWYRNKIHHYHSMNSEFGALAFFHIPLPEYNRVWERAVCYGEKNETVCCPEQNSGLFSSMVESGHMRGVFVGHDHINDYWGELFGIRLCYGRATGYNTYGKDNFLRGARIITLDNPNTYAFQTHIRLSDLSLVKQQKKHMPAFTGKEEYHI